MHNITLVFDGRCSFCTGITSLLKRLDLLHLIIPTTIEEYAALTGKNASDFDSVVVVDQGGKESFSTEAISRAILRIPPLFPAYLFLETLKIIGISDAVYRFIASRRYGLPSRIIYINVRKRT
ncbi:MAG: DCC1-like thiol-disulfide oxidoreductase family protein [Thermoplasmataceae archaeon]